MTPTWVLLLIMLVYLLNLRRHDVWFGPPPLEKGEVSILTGRVYFELLVRFYFCKGSFGSYLHHREDSASSKSG
jgi:hypothetical protein